MSQLPTQLLTDTWINATWKEYLQVVCDRAYEKAKSYYYKGRMRLEMSALGNPHSRDRAFEILDRGSRRIDRSQVITGLEIALLEAALRRSREMNHGKVSAWLLAQWQA